jgi:flagellar biosynthesis protein FliQ
VNIFIINGYGRFIFLFKFNQCDILSVLLSMERFPVYALIAVFYASYIVIYHEQMTFNDTFLSNIIFFFHCLKGINESIIDFIPVAIFVTHLIMFFYTLCGKYIFEFTSVSLNLRLTTMIKKIK